MRKWPLGLNINDGEIISRLLGDEDTKNTKKSSKGGHLIFKLRDQWTIRKVMGG